MFFDAVGICFSRTRNQESIIEKEKYMAEKEIKIQFPEEKIEALSLNYS